jgi:hypothetical protein
VDDESAVETELADMVRAGVRLRAIGRFFSSRPMVGGIGVEDAVSPFFVVVFSFLRVCGEKKE